MCSCMREASAWDYVSSRQWQGDAAAGRRPPSAATSGVSWVVEAAVVGQVNFAEMSIGGK